MKKIFKTLLFTIIFITIMSIYSIVNAASASLSASTKSITVGKSVTITVKSIAATTNLKISGAVSGSIQNINMDGENETKTKTYTFTPSKAGTYTVKLNGDITDENGTTSDVNDSITITATEATNTNNNTSTGGTTTTTTTKKSTNANLSTLGVTPKEYDFSGFKADKTSYSVTVPNNVDSLKVTYKTADSKATVKVSGNTGFETGSNNNIKVVVTAEDGKTTKTYNIKVTKLATEEEKPGNIIEDNSNELYLASLKIEGIDLSPEFSKNVYSYTATLSDANINEVKVEAGANTSKAKVEITGDKNLVEGENLINILVTLDGSSKQVVYQIILTKEATEVANVGEVNITPENNQGLLSNLSGNIKLYIKIAIITVILMIVAIIIIIYLLRKENKRLNSEEIEETEDDNKANEYNVYKNDENEFRKNNDLSNNNFVESLYRQRNGNLYNEEELDEEDKQNLEEINRETDKIFRDKVEGQMVEYDNNELTAEDIEKKKKGKHF